MQKAGKTAKGKAKDTIRATDSGAGGNITMGAGDTFTWGWPGTCVPHVREIKDWNV